MPFLALLGVHFADFRRFGVTERHNFGMLGVDSQTGTKARNSRMTASQKLKILYLAANPINTTQLRLDQELRDIQHALRLATHRHLFEVHDAWAVRIEDMRRAMLDFEPDIVHFAGHGGSNGIYLEDRSGRALAIPGDALQGFFANFPSVQCVILNACFSDDVARAISQVVPYVIGMSATAADVASIVFAVAFYDVLGAGSTYDRAYSVAANAVQLERLQHTAEPVLIRKSQTITNSKAPARYESASRHDSIRNQRTSGPSNIDPYRSHGVDGSPSNSVSLPISVWSSSASRYAQVYGITPGLTRFDRANSLLGEPTEQYPYESKFEALYADYGLRIIYDGDRSDNPHIQYMEISAANATELPHGLHRDMARPEWEAILSRVYGPAREQGTSTVAIFEPSEEMPGNRVVVMLRGDRIHRIAVYSRDRRQ